MISLYQEEIAESNDNEESDVDETLSNKDSTQHQLHKLCKLRIQLCQQIGTEALVSISDSIYTDWIEESK